MRRVLGIAVLLVVVTAGCGGGDNKDSGGSGGGSGDVSGTISLGLNISHPAIASQFQPGEACDGTNVADEFNDISAGTQIIVKDDAGKTIATGTLNKGGWSDDRKRCVIPFSVGGVPDAKFYEISIGSHHVTSSSRTGADFTLDV
jgi:hypothetical protein